MRYQFDIRGMQALKDHHDPKLVEKAFSQALDRTQRKVATHISRDVRDDYHITAADIKKRVTIKGARTDAPRSLLYVGRKLPLDKFKPKATRARVVTATSRRGNQYKTRRRGASVMVRKDRGRQQVPGGWLAKGRIWRREDQSDNASRPVMQFGPSIPGMVSHESVIESAQDMVREDLPRQFSGRMDYLLGR